MGYVVAKGHEDLQGNLVQEDQVAQQDLQDHQEKGVDQEREALLEKLAHQALEVGITNSQPNIMLSQYLSNLIEKNIEIDWFYIVS